MRTLYFDLDRSDLIPEEDKLKEEYLILNTEYNINTLVYDKTDLRKAYNYYNGVRDKEQFRGLEEHYGIGNSTCVEFTPLIRRHIDALVGEFLRIHFNPKVTCKDNKTLNKIEREKNIKIATEFVKIFQSYYATNKKRFQELGKIDDTLTQEHINKIISTVNKNFQSLYEVSAQHLITYFLNSKDLDIRNKFKTMLIDLLVAGSCYYKVYFNNIGEDPKLEVLNPLDVFYNKSTNDSFINDANRVVHREYLTRQEILNRYGHQLSEDDKEKLMGKNILTGHGEAKYYRTAAQTSPNYVVSNTGATLDKERLNYYLNEDVIAVYHSEWLANNEVEFTENVEEAYNDMWQVENENKQPKKIKRYRLDRYRCTRIGYDIYTDFGKDETVIRSVDKPYECKLSINGVSYSDRNGRPYSLILATAALQDKYDILHFHRDSLIANSGVKGDFVDVSIIPTFLGKKLPERITKWKKYKKAGMALIDPSQEGTANLNTIYGGYDDTIPGNAIEAINFTIQSIQETASEITGVSRQMLGNIEQRDAVSNVKVGINQSSIITKQFFFLIELMVKHSLTDMLDYAKISYKKGKKGSYILGNRRKFFTVKPKHFSFTDYDIHISNGENEYRDAETIKQLAVELARSGQVDVDAILELFTTESLTEMKEGFVEKAQEAKGKMIQEYQAQLEQLQTQLQKYEGEIKKLSKQANDLEAKKVSIDDFEAKSKAELEARKLDIEEEFNKAKLEEMKLRTELEKIQAELNPTDKDNEIRNLSI